MRKITFLVVALCATMFANAAITLPLSEDFAVCDKGSATATGSNMPEIGTATFAWATTLTKVYDAGGMIKFGASSATGSLVTDVISVTKDSVVIEFDAIGWSGTSDVNSKKITYGATTITIQTTPVEFPVTPEKLEHFKVVFAKEEGATLTIAGGGVKSRFFLDNLSITEKDKDSSVGVEIVKSAANVYGANGTIYGAENGRIYTITGMDVTEQNGRLNGVYVVKINGKVQKVMVR
jgi:hypothetical protein